MNEVEMTSEFAQLMISGIVGKTQRAIDKLYQDFDDAWAERAEVERRFRHCMDELDSSIGADLANTAFTNRSAFYGLFSITYDACFGIGSGLKKVKAEPTPTAFKTRAMKVSDAISNQTAPEKLLDALARRTTHKDSRKIVFDFIRTQLLRA
jgi:hypothetical protein